ncbi:MAG: hypothetical protein AAGB34_05880 [Planctomycetota bacterium]
MRLPVSMTAGCFFACSTMVLTSSLQGQEFEHRIEPTVLTGIHDNGGNGTADEFRTFLQCNTYGNGDVDYAIFEYDIQTLNAASIEYAEFGGLFELISPATKVPSSYKVTVYTANGVKDLGDADDTLQVLGTWTFDRLGFNALGADITTILKDRINAGDDYLGFRIEGTGNFAFATLKSASNGSWVPGFDLYVHTNAAGTQIPDDNAPSGTPSVVDAGDTFHFKGTNGNDSLIVDKSGSNIRFRNNSGTTYGTFPESAASKIRIDLYKGNDNASIYSSVNLPAEIYGGGGNDIINGSKKDDVIYGGSGNDTLTGNNGNDRLYGGDGTDTLKGSNGDDSLFGGFAKDTLTGNSGSDRFLRRHHSADNITDAGTSDTIIFLEAAGKRTTTSYTTDFGFWQDVQVERLDEIFDMWFDLVGTHAMLETPFYIDGVEWYTPLRVITRGNETSGNVARAASGFDGGMNLEDNMLGDWASYGTGSSLGNRNYAMNIITHEVGHSHENYAYPEFLRTRGWVSNPGRTVGLTQYPNGSSNWWHDSSSVAGFVSGYSRYAGNEDYAESWQAYVIDEANYPGVTWMPGLGLLNDIDTLPTLKAMIGDVMDHLGGSAYKTTVWYEDFLGLANNARSDTTLITFDSNWSTNDSFIAISSPVYGVQNYELELSETADTAGQVSYGYWDSEDIDVWQYTNLDVTLDVKSVGSLEASGPWYDWFAVQLIVDGVPSVSTYKLGNLTTNNVYEQISLSVPPGADEISIQLSWQTNAGEKYVVDNIVVTGDRSTPPLAN